MRHLLVELDIRDRDDAHRRFLTMFTPPASRERAVAFMAAASTGRTRFSALAEPVGTGKVAPGGE